MSQDAFKDLLGVSASSNPFVLLGLPPEPCTDAQIEAALRQALGRVYRHPHGRVEGANEVRLGLREAARTLMDPAGQAAALAAATRQTSAPARADGASGNGEPADRSQPPPAPPGRMTPRRPQLTEFDREVLAVIVGFGGWNAASRSRLIGLAADHGLSAPGLVKVIHGLSDYAKSGGPRLGTTEITAGTMPFRRVSRRRGPLASGPLARLAPSNVAPALAEKISDELSADSPWSRLRLSILFGACTIVLGGIAIRLLFTPAGSESPPAPIVTGEEAASAHAQPPPPRAERREEASGPIPMASFRSAPTFLGNGLPIEATSAADDCPRQVEELDLIARKLIVSDELAMPVARSWELSIETISTGWVLTDASTRRAIREGMLDVLFAASDTPTISDQLLVALTPTSGRVTEPIDLWRGAWLAGALSSLSGNTTLPPVVVERARALLAVVLEDAAVGKPPPFDVAARLWLDRALPQMVEGLEIDPDVYDSWELWLSAHRALGLDDRYQASVMEAIRAIARTKTDLSRPGPAINVMGRLVLAADFRRSGVVRDRMLAIVTDEQVSAHSLWVLTSLLARYDAAPWFEPVLVVPSEADWLRRRRARDRIAQAWPETAWSDLDGDAEGRGIVVNAEAGSRWSNLVELAARRTPHGSSAELMMELLIASRLNEAAASLAAQDRLHADRVMAAIGPVITGEEPMDSWADPAAAGGGQGQRARPGQPIGRDGEWAERYRQASRNSDEKVKALEDLAATAGTDLGPLDAEVLAHEVYRGAPRQVRTTARLVLLKQFASGPTVALELLDQLPGVPVNQDLSDTLEQYTGQMLPPSRSESWVRDARLVLLEHVLSLRLGGEGEVGRLAEAVIESITARAGAVSGAPSGQAPPGTPGEASRRLADAWRGRAAVFIVSDPMPDDLTALHRRQSTRFRLARGPVQQFVASQLGVLDLLAYVTVAEQPGQRDAVREILDESADRRRGMGHALEQAIEIERALSRIWQVRMVLGRPDDQEAPG